MHPQAAAAAALPSSRLPALPLRRLGPQLHEHGHVAAPNLKQPQHVVQGGLCKGRERRCG